MLGDLYARRQRLPEAIVQYKKAIDILADCLGAIHSLRKAYATQGANPAELAAFEEQQLAKRRPALERRTCTLPMPGFSRPSPQRRRSGDISQPVEMDKSSINALGALAEYLRVLQRYDEAITVFEEARQRMPDAFEASAWLKQQYAATLKARKKA